MAAAHDGVFTSGKYWAQREDFLYYRHIDYIVRTVGATAKSMLDVGTGNCPYMEWFDWIPQRMSVDLRSPYQSDSVMGMVGSIHEMRFDHKFDIVTCLQVLEHVPDALSFARRLLELGKIVVISVPYKWTTDPRTHGHIHDPVSYQKLTEWVGRQANYHEIAREPFQTSKHERLIAVYDVEDSERKFTSVDVKARRPRRAH